MALEKLIVSMTSYPARINSVQRALKSVMEQKAKGMDIHYVLALAEPEFPGKEASLPKQLSKYITDNKVEIIWTKTNTRSHKKLMPALSEYPDCPVLVIDDDVERPEGWLQTFIDDHTKYPDDIICGIFAYFYDGEKFQRIKTHHDKSGRRSFNGVPSMVFNFARPANGLGGVLYPARTFTDKRFFDESLYMKLSPTSDESWQWSFATMAGKTFRQLSKVYDSFSEMIEKTQDVPTSLHKINNYQEIFKRLFGYFPELKPAITKRSRKLVVSMTSYKERIKYIPQVVKSIEAQTLKPSKIVLTLYKDDVQYITKEVQSLIDVKKLELLVCNDFIKPHTKYFSAMKKYPDYAIVTVDDDVIYTEDMVQSLYRSYMAHPNEISARRVHKITYDKNGNIAPYNNWDWQYTRETAPSFELLATGVGGVLYPPNILNISDENLHLMKKCINADDVYLKWLECEKGIKTVWVKNNHLLGKKQIDEADAQANALYKSNVKKSRNDEYISMFKFKNLSHANSVIEQANPVPVKKKVGYMGKVRLEEDDSLFLSEFLQ